MSDRQAREKVAIARMRLYMVHPADIHAAELSGHPKLSIEVEKAMVAFMRASGPYE